MAAAGLLACAGCSRRGRSPNLEGPARYALVVANRSDAISLDPAVAYEFTSTAICFDFYETLIRYADGDYTRPLPGLAQSWRASRDGLHWTFTLRPGLRFASGAPLDAAAVRGSWCRTLAVDRAPAELLRGNLAPERIRVVEPRTLEVRLPRPCSYFLSTLFNPAAAIVDPTVARGLPDQGTAYLRDHSAGSGPFVLDDWEPDVAITMRRNERYWGPAPRLKRVIVKDVAESTTQQMMIARGDVDIAYDMNPLQIQDAVRESGGLVRALQVPFLRLFYLGMNVKHPPLDDVRVRQAIRAAIDYPELVRLGGGHAIPLQGPIIKGLLGYAPDLGLPGYDPTRSRALLAAAGHADGFDVELSSSGGSTGFGPTREDLCAKLQSDLGRVGIRVAIKTLSSTAYLDLYRGHKTQLNMGDWGADYPDPNNFAQPFGHSQGALAKRVQYSDPRLDPLIDRASEELAPGRRSALYRTVQEILMRDGPWAVLLQPLRVLPVRAEVYDYHYDYLSPMAYGSVFKGAP